MADQSKATMVSGEASTIPPAHVLDTSEDVLKKLRGILNNMGQHGCQTSGEFQQILAMYKELGVNLHEARRRVEASKPAAPSKAATVMAKIPGSISLLGNIKGPPRDPGAASPDPASTAESEQSPETMPAEPAAEYAPIQLLALPKFAEALGPAGKPGVLAMGEEVAYLQRVLTHLGYEVEETEVYDKATVSTVRAFQKDHGLEPSDVVGADMRVLLNQVVSGDLA